MKRSGLGNQFYAAGYDLSGDVGSLSKIGGGPALLDVTPINVSAFVRLGGQRNGYADFTAFHDTAAGHEHAALSPLPRGDVDEMFLISTTLGDPAASIRAKQLNYDLTRATSGMLTFNVAEESNGFGLEWGRTLTPGLLSAANYLSGNASTFEGGIANWVANTNCAIAQTAAQAHGGTKSLELTSTASGNMSAAHVTASPNGTGGFVVIAGAAYTVSGWFRSAVSVRTCAMQVSWYGSAGVFLSTTTGSTVSDSTSAWTQATSDHTAPAGAVYAIVLGQVQATGAGSEVHYLDDVLMVTSAGASVDDTGSSAFGLQAYLQVTAFTGTDVTVKLQDSANNTSFGDLTGGGFVATTAAHTTQRIATSNSATVRRYVRVALTTSAGFTSLSFAVAYIRNEIANQVF